MAIQGLPSLPSGAAKKPDLLDKLAGVRLLDPLALVRQQEKQDQGAPGGQQTAAQGGSNSAAGPKSLPCPTLTSFSSATLNGVEHQQIVPKSLGLEHLRALGWVVPQQPGSGPICPFPRVLCLQRDTRNSSSGDSQAPDVKVIADASAPPLTGDAVGSGPGRALMARSDGQLSAPYGADSAEGGTDDREDMAHPSFLSFAHPPPDAAEQKSPKRMKVGISEETATLVTGGGDKGLREHQKNAQV